MNNELSAEVEQGIIHPVYLFYGSETFLMEDICKQIQMKVIGTEGTEWGRTVVDLAETPIQDLVREAETPSFFGQHRVVIGKNAWLLTGVRKKTNVNHQVDELVRYIRNPVEGNVVILTVPADKLDTRKKVVKELKSHVREGVFPPLMGKELLAWVKKRFQQTKRDIHPQAGECLIQRVGHPLRLLATEIDKLATYTDATQCITPELVCELVPRQMEQDVFKLVDCVTKRQLGAALAIYHDLLRNREEPVRILALLIRQFRLLLQVKGLTAQGRGEREIASLLKIHPYPVKLAAQQTPHYPEKLLRFLLIRAIDADIAIKEGRIEKTIAVERVLLSVME